MRRRYNRILIITDIEGSSGCWSYRASCFMTRPWARACLDMTRDVDAVARALFAAGVRKVSIRDFHRTGYNLLSEHMDPRTDMLQGYRAGPIPGIGDPKNTQAVMFLGMHAASGSGGFLPHTLTSRIKQLKVNGRLLSEAELFAASLAPSGLRPIFFSGDATACRQAADAIHGIRTYPIDKTVTPQNFAPERWRGALSLAAVAALDNRNAEPYEPPGPFQATLVLRDGVAAARKLAQRWHLRSCGAELHIDAGDIHDLYRQLVNVCYLTPTAARVVPAALWLSNLHGRLGLWWVRRYLRKKDAAFTPFHPEAGI